LKSYIRYFGGKIGWFLITLVAAFILNFTLPRLMPGDPVAGIVARVAQGMSDATGVQAIYEQYTELFGTNLPIHEQFFLYLRNVARGDFGFSFSQYPRSVADVIASSIWWTVILQLPAIVVGWLIGNFLGALAAYRKSGFDKVLMPASIFASSLPAFGMAVILLVRDCPLPIALLVDRVGHHRRSGHWHAFHGYL
jgi:peptide/nickel transport system permease protein